MTLDLRGVMPPVPTVFDDAGEIDLNRFSANFARWNQYGLAGYVVLGSNGEFATLSETEKLALVERARSVIPSDRLLITGTGVESTRGTLDLTRRAAELGADAAIVITPHYYRPSYDNAAFVRHYLTIAEGSPIPILVYNMPLYAGVDLAVDVLVELSRHPNIVGYKESAPNVVKIAEVASRAAPHFHPLAGSASYLHPAMAVGATGAIAALANVAPAECLELYEASRLGDVRAKALQHRLLAPNAAVTTRFGIAGLKAALDYLGYAGGAPRSPASALGERERATIAGVFQAAGISPVT